LVACGTELFFEGFLSFSVVMSLDLDEHCLHKFVCFLFFFEYIVLSAKGLAAIDKELVGIPLVNVLERIALWYALCPIAATFCGSSTRGAIWGAGCANFGHWGTASVA
jgi:hypothetical protein